jgi:hypothetical protein
VEPQPMSMMFGVMLMVMEMRTIYCAVSFVFQPGDQKILTIKNNNVDSLSFGILEEDYILYGRIIRTMYMQQVEVYLKTRKDTGMR